VHCPKTGGTFVSRVMQHEVSGRRLGGTHDPAWMMSTAPARFRTSGAGLGDGLRLEEDDFRIGRTVSGTLRAPAAWYLSLYLHAASRNGGCRRQMAMYGGDEWDPKAPHPQRFRQILYGLTHPREREILPAFMGLLISCENRSFPAYQASGMGLASWYTAYMYGADPAPMEPVTRWAVDVLVDIAALYDELPALLGISAARVRRYGRQNTARLRPAPAVQGPDDPAEWYDDEMLGWVYSADGWLYGFAGFADPFGPGTPRLDVGRA